MALDGLRGLSPVTQCRVALGLSSSLQQSREGLHRAGLQAVRRADRRRTRATRSSSSDIQRRRGSASHGGVENMHRVAVVTGDVKFTPVGFSADDAQFLAAARTVRPRGRADLPGAGVGDRRADRRQPHVRERRRAEPGARHVLAAAVGRCGSRARSATTPTCAPATRTCSSTSTGCCAPTPSSARRRTRAALNPETGWMRRDEVRELEDLPPESEAA